MSKILFFVLFFLFSLFYQITSVRAVDIIETESVTISATVPGIIVTPSGGASGSSYTEPIKIPETAVQFSGLAYPFAEVIVSKNGNLISQVSASSQGLFNVTLGEEYDKNALYSVQAKDLDGNKSLLLNYPMVVEQGYLTHLSGILFAPTLVLDKTEVLLGDFITISGYALPNKTIDISITGETNKVFTLTTTLKGTYSITAPLSGLPLGSYNVSINYRGDGRLSKIMKFVIGNKNVLIKPNTSTIPGDCNKDNIINIVDFSVLAFWYKKPNPPSCVDTNQDNTVDLIDFSILAFYWTG